MQGVQDWCVYHCEVLKLYNALLRLDTCDLFGELEAVAWGLITSGYKESCAWKRKQFVGGIVTDVKVTDSIPNASVASLINLMWR